MLSNIPTPVLTIGLLICSNLFMTIAWYGHLKFPTASIWHVIVISWLIAFFEYCLQVPANRTGYGYFTAAELKTIQEIISLTIFMIFSALARTASSATYRPFSHKLRRICISWSVV